MEKIGLVLEGGALRGLFTAGVIDFMLDKNIMFPYVIGVSAGTCNALDYLSKQNGRGKACMIQNNETWYYGLKEFKSSHKLINLDKVFNEYPYNQYPFDFDTYFNSDIVNEIVVTNCLNGKSEYHTEKKDPVRLSALAEASSSMPLLTDMMKIDGIPYLDGGLSDSIPVQRAFDMGCTKCVVVLTRRKGSQAKQLLAEKKLYSEIYKDYPELAETILNRPTIYKQQLKLIDKLEKEGKIFVIRPDIPNIKRLENDYARLVAFYDRGYMIARDVYPDMMKFINN